MVGMNLNKAARIFKTTLDGYHAFWCVAGGWAVDLYLNRQTRTHEDLEIVVLRNDNEKLFQHFKRFNPQKIISGETPTFTPWQGEPVEPEVIQLRLDPVQSTDFDLLLSPSEDGKWICRRDESIRLPFSQVAIMCDLKIPVLAPEIVLLFKAKYLREKDQQDYANLIKTITPEAREWLSSSLKQIHPGHPWISSN